MPTLGDIIVINGGRRIWSGCVDCGTQRWVALIGARKGSYVGGKPRKARCRKCAAKLKPPPVWSYFKSGSDNIGWKGGRRTDQFGYIQVRVYDDSPFASMRNVTGYVKEHRLVMAQSLGRCLLAKESVHHKDRNKHNNTLENLVLMDKNSHFPLQHYREEIAELKRENQRLRQQLLGVSVES